MLVFGRTGAFTSRLRSLAAENVAKDIRTAVFAVESRSGFLDFSLKLPELAAAGNGSYSYLLTTERALQALKEHICGPEINLAGDVDMHVEFNTAVVVLYRQIGYENRHLAQEASAASLSTARQVGWGQTTTALYEIVPLANVTAQGGDLQGNENLLLTLKLRLRDNATEAEQLLELPVRDNGKGWEDASPDFKFACAVAGFGMLLSEAGAKGELTIDTVQRLAREGAGHTPNASRAEFLDLVETGKRLLTD